MSLEIVAAKNSRLISDSRSGRLRSVADRLRPRAALPTRPPIPLPRPSNPNTKSASLDDQQDQNTFVRTKSALLVLQASLYCLCIKKISCYYIQQIACGMLPTLSWPLLSEPLPLFDSAVSRPSSVRSLLRELSSQTDTRRRRTLQIRPFPLHCPTRRHARTEMPDYRNPKWNGQV